MIDVKLEILYFLRDSMFRIGELGYDLAKMKREGVENQKIYFIKKQLLWELMQCNHKYLCNEKIFDPQFVGLNNYLDNVDEKTILEDLHFWRERAGLNEVAYMEHPSYTTMIDYFRGTQEIPEGSFGYVLGWNLNNDLVPVIMDELAGDSGNINTF